MRYSGVRRFGRGPIWLAICCILLAFMASVPVHSYAVVSGTVAGEKLVLAFYYMWYGPADFAGGKMADLPLTAYSSDKNDVIQQQVSQARGAGIDAFVASWTGAGTDTDANFSKLLDEAARQNFRATVYVETNSVMQHGDVAAQVQSLVQRFGNNPAFLRWNGKPVLFFWSPQSLGEPDVWRGIRQKVDPQNSQVWSVDTIDRSYLDVFDTVHLFSGGKWNPATDVAATDMQWRARVDTYNKAHNTQKLWTAGVIPGWDESRVLPLRNPPKMFDRHDGAMYEEDWRAAIASNPEWVTITSWNEWFEGTQIEPGQGYGSQYLDLTRKYATLWKHGPGPCDGGTAFPQTGYSICHAMEGYWRQYGGLAQFGYPISKPSSEKNAVDGKEYTVQYFERARFELHPEKQGTPYEVQLGLLGRQFHSVEPPTTQNNAPGSRYFPETGHSVNSTFYRYWLDHGGLFVNGFPISEETREKMVDGKFYTVQYFERTRFESHPENTPPNNVLLGLLGRMAWAQKVGK